MIPQLLLSNYPFIYQKPTNIFYLSAFFLSRKGARKDTMFGAAKFLKKKKNTYGPYGRRSFRQTLGMDENVSKNMQYPIYVFFSTKWFTSATILYKISINHAMKPWFLAHTLHGICLHQDICRRARLRKFNKKTPRNDWRGGLFAFNWHVCVKMRDRCGSCLFKSYCIVPARVQGSFVRWSNMMAIRCCVQDSLLPFL
jgi:hypothetical protein